MVSTLTIWVLFFSLITILLRAPAVWSGRIQFKIKLLTSVGGVVATTGLILGFKRLNYFPFETLLILGVIGTISVITLVGSAFEFRRINYRLYCCGLSPTIVLSSIKESLPISDLECRIEPRRLAYSIAFGPDAIIVNRLLGTTRIEIATSTGQKYPHLIDVLNEKFRELALRTRNSDRFRMLKVAIASVLMMGFGSYMCWEQIAKVHPEPIPLNLTTRYKSARTSHPSTPTENTIFPIGNESLKVLGKEIHVEHYGNKADTWFWLSCDLAGLKEDPSLVMTIVGVTDCKTDSEEIHFRPRWSKDDLRFVLPHNYLQLRIDSRATLIKSATVLLRKVFIKKTADACWAISEIPSNPVRESGRYRFEISNYKAEGKSLSFKMNVDAPGSYLIEGTFNVPAELITAKARFKDGSEAAVFMDSSGKERHCTVYDVGARIPTQICVSWIPEIETQDSSGTITNIAIPKDK